MTNRLFVAYKPSGISSNHYLGKLKRTYGLSKMGFSGILDPFAQGTLVIASGQYTKLFRFFKTAPKRYRATLWLGALSATLDSEAITAATPLAPLDLRALLYVLTKLEGPFHYTPPQYSAKKIAGKRARDRVRAGETPELAPVTSHIYDITLRHYRHPFVTFEATVSEGTYIRSPGAAIAAAFGTTGALTMLERLSEGDFHYDAEKPLDPPAYLDLPTNHYHADPQDIMLGRVLQRSDFANPCEGDYVLNLGKMLSIITITSDTVRYVVNKVELC